eukprot:CAMPEP_0172920056 /NCGR_PEP_ID=MMETSP1075-20121228/203313_1 /TAXON_ID=2916 /ORGANISM="Ceratium fusus, Strain PA161109" /LENGTH=115 /DNA_ID=CAMNT_0013780009 /DNA_START=220 /DNA_END=567 /DNA_ORIENTATION=-
MILRGLTTSSNVANPSGTLKPKLSMSDELKVCDAKSRPRNRWLAVRPVCTFLIVSVAPLSSPTAYSRSSGRMLNFHVGRTLRIWSFSTTPPPGPICWHFAQVAVGSAEKGDSLAT